MLLESPEGGSFFTLWFTYGPQVKSSWGGERERARAHSPDTRALLWKKTVLFLLSTNIEFRTV